MDSRFRRISHGIRRRLESAARTVPRHPQLRRRLYGALFFTASLALGFGSLPQMRRSAVEAWLADHPPSQELWNLLSLSKGLRQIPARQQLEGWYRHMPRDLHPHEVWWDENLKALWVGTSNPKGDPSFSDNALLPEVTLWAGSSKPPRSSFSASSARPLGIGWHGFHAVRTLPAIQEPKQEVRRIPTKKGDPRQWNF